MIDLYSFPTPNGHKVHIALEELELPYNLHPVNISSGEQFAPEFLAFSPNNKIPAIVDQDGIDGSPFALFESGAILIYLAEKAGKLLPQAPADRYRTLQWLMFQMGGVGPMLGQAHHFRIYAPEKIAYGIERYTREAQRLYTVVNTQLCKSPYLAGEAYTIADIATFPWLRLHERQGVSLDGLDALKEWLARIEERPAVKRGLGRFDGVEMKKVSDEEAKKNLFQKDKA